MSEQLPTTPSKRRFAIPISIKLLTATAVVGMVAAVIAIIGLNRMQIINRNLTETVDFLTTNIKLVSLMKQDLFVLTRAEKNMVLAQSEDGTAQFAKVVQEVSGHLDTRINEFRTVVLDDHRAEFDQFCQELAKWRANHQDVVKTVNSGADSEAHKISVGEAQLAFEKLEVELEKVRLRFQGQLESAKAAKNFQRSTEIAEHLAVLVSVLRSVLETQKVEKDLILATTEAEMGDYREKLISLKKNLETEIDRLIDVLDPEDGESIANIRKAHQSYLEAHNRIEDVAGDKAEFLAYHYLYDVGMPIADECETILDGLINKKEKLIENHRKESQKAYSDARNTLLGVSIFGILFSVAVSFYTGQNIARRLSTLSRHAKRIQTTGDLSRPTPQLGNDEVGSLADSFENMQNSLHEQTERLERQTARLRAVTRKMELKNKEMEQFVYTVSHDLKSPLVSCKGLLGLLKEDVADGDYEAVLKSTEMLEQATDQLNQIIEDLLMLSRIGRKALELSEVNVQELVEDLLEELAPRIQEASASVEVQEDLSKVVADPTSTKRVFDNLLTNALKYGCKTSDGKIEIGEKVNNDEVCYFVRDNGPGIEPQYHGRVFGLFQRLDSEEMGTGLGLASVAKIMEIHGGRTWVESDVGQGATFWIAFPRVQPQTEV